MSLHGLSHSGAAESLVRRLISWKRETFRLLVGPELKAYCQIVLRLGLAPSVRIMATYLLQEILANLKRLERRIHDYCESVAG